MSSESTKQMEMMRILSPRAIVKRAAAVCNRNVAITRFRMRAALGYRIPMHEAAENHICRSQSAGRYRRTNGGAVLVQGKPCLG